MTKCFIHTWKRTVPPLLVALLILMSTAPLKTRADAPDNVPPLTQLIWLWPQEITWRPDLGAIWISVGHTATVLLIEPAGVDERDGEIISTMDGSGAIHSVKLTALSLTGFHPETNAPQFDAAPPLAELVIDADNDNAGARKRGLHKTRAGHWDFGFGWLPTAPYTLHRYLHFNRSEQFKYCLVIHVESELEPLPDYLAEKAGSRNTFKDIKIHVLVSQLFEDPEIELTSTWAEGEPMPQNPPPSRDWYQREEVKARWMLTSRPLRAEVGGLSYATDVAVSMLPADRTIQDIMGAIAAEDAEHEEAERRERMMRDIERRDIIPDLDDL